MISLPAAFLMGLPLALIGVSMGLDLYLKRFPIACDDLWRLPRPSSLR